MRLGYHHLYRHLPWLIALLATLLCGYLGYEETRGHTLQWKDRLTWNAQAHRAVIQLSNREKLQKGRLVAQSILRDPTFIHYVERAHQLFAEPESAEQRQSLDALQEQLRDLLVPAWSDFQLSGGKQLSVMIGVDTATVPFVHMHDPQWQWHNTVNDRAYIERVFTKRTPLSGDDISHAGSAFRVMMPIISPVATGEQVLGVIDIGVSLLPLLMADDLSAGRATFLHHTAVERLLSDETRHVMNERYPALIKYWRLEETTNARLAEWWGKGRIHVDAQGQLIHDQDRTFLLSWIVQDDTSALIRHPHIAVVAWNDVTDGYASFVSQRRLSLLKWLGILAACLLTLWAFVRINKHYIKGVIRRHRAMVYAEHHAGREAQQRLEMALKSSESGFWEWDITRNIAHFSMQWRQMCGLGPESPSSLDLEEWTSRLHPADKQVSYHEYVRHLKGETPMLEYEYRIRTESGDYRWVLTRGKVIERLPNGEATLMVGIFTDITERKLTEQTNVRQQLTLEILYDIASNASLDVEEQLLKALKQGADYLGLEEGAIKEISGKHCFTRVSYSATESPQTSPADVAKHYCGKVMTTNHVVAEDNIPDSDLASHPAYIVSRRESYIGVPLVVGGKTYGTLSFSARKSRRHAYDQLDIDFVSLTAKFLGNIIERWIQESNHVILENRLLKLSQRIPGVLYEFVRDTSGRYSYSYISNAAEFILGVKPADAMESYLNVFNAIHPEDRAWLEESIYHSAKNVSPWVAFLRYIHPTRGMRWLHAESIPESQENGSICWHGYITDVTDIKQKEDALQEATALKHAIFEATNITIIATDKVGVIKMFNRGAEILLGYRAEELVDKLTPMQLHLESEVMERAQALSDIYDESIEPSFEVFARNALLDEIEHFWHYRHKDGTLIPVALRVTIVRDEKGEATGYVGIARDMRGVTM